MAIELSQERREFLGKDFQRGFIDFCGIRATTIESGTFESTLSIGENHKTQDNFIHAGLIATISDHTAGYAAYTLMPDNMRVLTIEFKINFLKPAYGNALLCKSEIISQGKQIIVGQSTVFDIRDTHQKKVSQSTITLMALDAGRLVGPS
jgi:uncharacterized protein (TIGR00369 family)